MLDRPRSWRDLADEARNSPRVVVTLLMIGALIAAIAAGFAIANIILALHLHDGLRLALCRAYAKELCAERDFDSNGKGVDLSKATEMVGSS
jgi:hypothetical protein